MDESIIRNWWQTWPSANIGICTGKESALVVLDVDPRHGGDDSFRTLEKTQGALPKTVLSLTGGGGQHYLFQHPGVDIRNKAGLSPGLDIRGDGGYIVAPPSSHLSGRTYQWDCDSHPDETSLAPLPEWLLERLVQPSARAAVVPEGSAIAPGG